ncbi:hypothetical protein BOH78_0836 [Pichia kudriavzevii]|nr:hypothetical protein BOH78_0836 [Pichia kudriavzevii]
MALIADFREALLAHIKLPGPKETLLISALHGPF